MLLLTLYVSTIVLELLFYHRALWPYHRAVVALLTPIVTGLMLATVADGITLPDMIIVGLSIIRLINYLRIAENRIHDAYLYRTAIRTSYVACSLQIILIGLELVGALAWLSVVYVIYAILLGQLIAAVTMLASLARSVRGMQYSHDTDYIADRDLPTVTVAIPARNETRDLQACLDTVVTSNYPKLEILVLDDCSHTKPSDTIKAYARSGVRFIKGDIPKHGWLAKNQAYDKLSREATGEIILFCGVDVRFGTNTIRALVTTMTLRKKAMISVMPKRSDSSLLNGFTQPTRYLWEIALPRRYIGRPAVLSTVWMIRRNSLTTLGGMKSVKRMVIPEGFFARSLSKQNDAYSFMRASNDLELQTVKSPREQWATAVRTRYPQLNKRPENALGLIALQATVFLLPYWLLSIGIFLDVAFLIYVSTAAIVLLTAIHVTTMYLTNPTNTWIALINLPICIVIDMIATITSLIRYEFGTVTWKERNICIPVMHTRRPLQHENLHA